MDENDDFTVTDRIAQMLRETEMLRAKLIRQETQISLFLDQVRKVLDEQLHTAAPDALEVDDEAA